MTKAVPAEYLANEQKLRLDAPLEGVQGTRGIGIFSVHVRW